ncbi:ribosome maturation factor RimM [Kineosporia sp. J2-2]|uniref:Ribosome maturation factor RimM n=1 Tax=Kineosporia corallincola TaxID=2835133 RepID=A0ABS5THC6_9ACTN|nr:ribosome maturation factor RimM [Kineosporia corallincola]MBT0769799.1 ribosome maturation factor RimM [Kineosporia corallincola]
MRLVVARIGRAHGLRGEVSIEVRTDNPGQRFVKGAVLHLEDGSLRRSLAASGIATSLTLDRVRDNNGVFLLTFEEVADRTTAEALRNAVLEVEVPDASDEPDAWYDHELVGLTAVGTTGDKLGEVVAVQHPGAQDLLVIRTPKGEDRLVPFVGALVPEVDVAGGRVVLDPPPGLLEDLDD